MARRRLNNINGTSDDDHLNGSSRADRIFGRDGDDVLRGRDGNDVLRGGQGRDRLVGGDGADTFVFTRGDGRDTIQSFEVGRDKFSISGFRGLDADDIFDIARQRGDDIIIRFGDNNRGDVLVIENFDLSKLSLDDFF